MQRDWQSTLKGFSTNQIVLLSTIDYTPQSVKYQRTTDCHQARKLRHIVNRWHCPSKRWRCSRCEVSQRKFMFTMRVFQGASTDHVLGVHAAVTFSAFSAFSAISAISAFGFRVQKSTSRTLSPMVIPLSF